jgi:CCR4-NOT transcription complex subunit 1
VVERSVTIAAISAYQLVIKDFVTEPDETKVRTAAHNMVKKLAGSLAMVTCREPLRMSMSNNVRAVASKIPDSIPEGSILMFVNDNIDIVCRVIEEAAERHSVPEIDASLSEWFQRRPPTDQPQANRYAYAIPEPFRPAAGGLRPEQLAIYENFGLSGPTLASSNPAQEARSQLPESLQEQFAGVPGLPAVEAAPARQAAQQRMISNTPMMNNQTQLNGYSNQVNFIDTIESLFTDLSRVVREATEEHIGQLGKASPVREVYEQLIQFIEPHQRRETISAYLADKALSELFQRLDRSLDIEVFCQFLQHLCGYSVETARYVYMTLANVQDEQILHPVLFVALLRTRLIDVQRADTIMSKLLIQKDASALQCFSSLVDDFLLNDHPQAIRANFAKSYDALVSWLYADPDFEPIKALISKLGISDQTPISATKLDEVEQIFDEWLQVYRPDVSEKIIVSFINQLQKREMFKTANDAAHFVRGCMELSILSYEQEEAAPFGGSIDQAYLYVDALASLIVALTTYYSDAQSDDESDLRGKFFEALLSALVLHQVHHIKQRGDQMNQKVYFRLWSSLLNEVQHILSPNVSHVDLFNRLAFAFLALSPCYVPGFAFGWLALVSHRIFIPAMLNMGSEQVCLLFNCQSR